jgi:hypothetical protein
MEQPNLFGSPNAYGDFTPPRAARNDPPTSHEAGARVGRSERAARHRAIVLGLVRRCPGGTGMELWHAATDDERRELETPNEVWRKLNDLRHANLVMQGDDRPCTIRHVRMVTWLPTPAR